MSGSSNAEPGSDDSKKSRPGTTFWLTLFPHPHPTSPQTMPSSNPPTFAARSIPQTPFDHKIHLQNHFSRKFQPRFNFHCQKTDFTGRNPRKIGSCNHRVKISLYMRPSTFHYYNDHGILQKTGNTGKGGGKSSQGKIQCLDSQAHARGPGEEVPGTRYLLCNGECHEDGQEVQADERPLPHLIGCDITITTPDIQNFGVFRYMLCR